MSVWLLAPMRRFVKDIALTCQVVSVNSLLTNRKQLRLYVHRVRSASSSDVRTESLNETDGHALSEALRKRTQTAHDKSDARVRAHMAVRTACVLVNVHL